MLKAHFPILEMMSSYKPSRQPLIVVAFTLFIISFVSRLKMMLCLDMRRRRV